MSKSVKLSSSSLNGTEVVNLQGEDLGKLEDLMIDTENGQIAYAILSFGGFLGLGNKLFAIPWQALTVNTGDKKLMLDVDKDKLEDAPGFDKNDWPSSENQAFLDSVYSHYGYEAYSS